MQGCDGSGQNARGRLLERPGSWSRCLARPPGCSLTLSVPRGGGIVAPCVPWARGTAGPAQGPHCDSNALQQQRMAIQQQRPAMQQDKRMAVPSQLPASARHTCQPHLPEVAESTLVPAADESHLPELLLRRVPSKWRAQHHRGPSEVDRSTDHARIPSTTPTCSILRAVPFRNGALA